jgi:hypothetical protein
MITPTFIPVIRRKRNPHIDPNYKAQTESEPRREEPGEIAKVEEPASQEQSAGQPGGGGDGGLTIVRNNLVNLIAARADKPKAEKPPTPIGKIKRASQPRAKNAGSN